MRINAGDKNAGVARDKAIADTYGNKFIIPLDFAMLDSAAPYYQAGLGNRLCYDHYNNNEEDVFCDTPTASSLPAGCKPNNQLDYFRQIIRAYQGRDEDAVKYVKKVKALIDKPLDELGARHVRLAMAKVKCPRKLDISVSYQLTRRLPHEGLDYDDERLSIHFYDTFYNESIKLLGRTVRCKVNVLYHLLDKIGKEPNTDLFQFMKGPCHQRTEEEIELVFKNLGWDYSQIKLV